jgi:hypothetical protein
MNVGLNSQSSSEGGDNVGHFLWLSLQKQVRPDDRFYQNVWFDTLHLVDTGMGEQIVLRSLHI